MIKAAICAAVCVGLTLLLASGRAEAQGRSAATPAGSVAADSWIFSETESPVDYAPVTIASAWSNADADGRAIQLSIQCRRGRTDLVILSPAFTGRVDEARVSYDIDGAEPIPLPSSPAPAGGGVAIKGDVVRLLTSLPARGELGVHVTQPRGVKLDGRYALSAFSTALKRLAAPCKWPSRTP
jgi:hypothetical protein